MTTTGSSHPARPRARTDLLREDVAGETLVLDPMTGQIHHLNQTATAVLDLCDGRHTMAAIVEVLSERFVGASVPAMQAQVQTLVAEVSTLGLLETATA